MDWNTEFNIDIKQVAKEVRQIGEEKKVIYDDYGKAVPKKSYYQELRDRPCWQVGITCLRRATLIEMPHPEENYLVEKLCRLLESGKDQEYILKKYGTSSDVIQALLDAEDFVKL